MNLSQEVQQADKDSITVSYRWISPEAQPGHFAVRVQLVLGQRQIEWQMDSMPINTSISLTLDEGQRLRLLATQGEFLIDSSGLARTFSLTVYEATGE